MDSARRADSKETAALWQANAALREAEFGNATAARQNAMSALASNGKGVTTMAALALGRAGEAAQAQTLADNLDWDFPLATPLCRSTCSLSIRAAIELTAKNGAKAVQILKTALPDQSWPNFLNHSSWA